MALKNFRVVASLSGATDEKTGIGSHKGSTFYVSAENEDEARAKLPEVLASIGLEGADVSISEG